MRGRRRDSTIISVSAEPLENEINEAQTASSHCFNTTGKLFYHATNAERMEIDLFGNRIVEHNRTIGFYSVDRWEKIRRLLKSKRIRKIWSFVVNKGDEGEEFLERNMGHARCLLCGFDVLRRCGDINVLAGE